MKCPQCGNSNLENARECETCGASLRREPVGETQRHVIFTTSSIVEASMLKGLLDANGIDAFLLDENISRINPLLTNAVGGIKVVIHAVQREEAEEVIREYFGNETYSLSGKLSPFDFKGRHGK